MSGTLAAVGSLGSRNCCEVEVPYKPSRLSLAIEIVGRVALTLFSFLLAPLYTAITYSIGAIGGCTYALVKDIKKTITIQGDAVRPACAQGYLERLTGKRWPIPVTQIVTDFFIGLHTYHDPKIFGPLFCGLFTGFWTGRFAANGCIDITRRLWKKSLPQEVETNRSCCHCPSS